jgi:hypothetical protein
VAANQDRQLWELSVAINALRLAVVGLPQAILAAQQQQISQQQQPGQAARKTATGRSRTTRGRASSAGDALASLVRPLMAIAGPLAVFASILQAGNSGFKLLMTAVQLLAASLAPILLPVVFMIAVAFAMLGEMIWQKLLPHLEAWMTLVISNLIPVVEGLVKGFAAAIDFLARFAQGLRTAGEKLGSWIAEKLGFKDPDKMPGVAPVMIQGARREDPSKRNTLPRGTDKSQLGGMAGFTQEQLDEIARQSGSMKPKAGGLLGAITAAGQAKAAAGDTPTGGSGSLAASLAAAAKAGEAKPGGAPGGGKAGVGEMMKDMVTELRNKLSPQAQFTQLTQIGRQVQMAAFQSPFEAKMLERMTQSVNALDKVVQNTAPKTEATH